MMKKLLCAVLAAAMILPTLFATGCSDSKSEKLAVKPEKIEIEQYEETRLTLNKEGTSVWSSSDPLIVKVEDGKITSLKMGSAVITATVGEESSNCEVTVIKSTKNRSLIISDSEVNLYLGIEGQESKKVSASLKELGNEISGVNLTWTSDDSSIADIADCMISAKSEGTATITVSTKYKGQSFAKEISVTVRNWTHKTSSMKLSESTTSSTLNPYTGNVTEKGFKDGESVTEYCVKNSAELWNNRIMADGAINSSGDFAYDRMIFDISFPAAPTGDIIFWMYDKVKKIAGGNVTPLGLDFSLIVFDRESGNVFSGPLARNHVYTFIVHLNQPINKENKSWGMAISQDITAYIANVVCCSDDYYFDNYADLKQPAEPFTDVYFVSGDNLDKLATDADGNCVQTFADGDLWAKRVYIGCEEWPVISDYTAMKEKYDYYGFEIIFKDSFAGAIWTGGKAILLNADGTLGIEGGGEINAGDIYIYDPNGKYVTGKALSLNAKYSIKVKIQKEEDGVYQNFSFGVGVNAGAITLSNPYLIKQDVPDPIPEPVDDNKIDLAYFVCGDSQTKLKASVRQGYTDWSEQDFDATSLWGKRVYGWSDGMSFATMETCAYYCMDVVFLDNLNAIVWCGDTASSSLSEGVFTGNNILVYDAEGKEVTAALQLGVEYTLKIKISYYADNKGNNCYGIGINGAGTLLVKNAYLLKT